MFISTLVERVYRILKKAPEEDWRVDCFTSSETLFQSILHHYPRRIECVEDRSSFARLIPTYRLEGLEPALLAPILANTPGDYLLRTTLRGDFVRERQGNHLSLTE